MAKTATLEEMVSEVLADDQAAKADMQELREQDAAAFEIGKPPRTGLVNTVDAKGEAIAVEVPIEASEDTPAVTTNDPLIIHANVLILPGFEGHVMNAAVVNISGRYELSLQSEGDAALWQAMRLGNRVSLLIEGGVVARPHSLVLDKDGDDKETRTGASVKVQSIALAD